MEGAPLYEFSGDADGKFGCTTRPAKGWDPGLGTFGVYTCTGPESDISKSTTDDWPALATTGTPVAGHGVDQELLGTVERPGVGDQVTYGGHPLYLFDPPSHPFAPQGEGYFESVYPMFPWHGIWYLVSARDGRPAPGQATVGTEILAGKKPALAYVEAALNGVTVTVYSYSLDRVGASVCTGACAVTWPPLLTTGEPKIGLTVATNHVVAQDLGVARRPDGTDQVTGGASRCTSTPASGTSPPLGVVVRRSLARLVPRVTATGSTAPKAAPSQWFTSRWVTRIGPGAHASGTWYKNLAELLVAREVLLEADHGGQAPSASNHPKRDQTSP
jgi:predicted lipoprotein with Yx(FWY)xxD motif